MKQNTIALLIALLLISVFIATILMLPHIDEVQPDPYFHVRATPAIYWIGFGLAILVSMGIVFFKKEAKAYCGLGLFSIMLLSAYVYDIPRLFYANPIYTDTYLFVGELFSTISHGYVGSGHAQETPGLALFSSQFCLVTGIGYLIIAEIVQLIIPLLVIFLVYMVGQRFANKRVALLACLAFMSVDWIGFYFNRQSFAFMLQLFVYFCILGSLLLKSRLRRSWYVISLLSYSALVISHPLSSLVVLLTTLVLVASLYFSFVRARLMPKKVLMIRVSTLLLAFFIIWLSWNIYVNETLGSLVTAIIQMVREFAGQPNPLEPAKSFVTGYTSVYLLVVDLRLFTFVSEAIIGMILGLYAISRMRSGSKSIILLSWFIACMSIAPLGLYIGHFLDRSFLNAFPVFSILIAWFTIARTPENSQPRHNRKIWLKITKGVLIGSMIVFILALPVTMYCDTPFMYPPTAYLAEMNHVTKYGYGYVAIYEVDSAIGYFKLMNNGSNVFIDFQYDYTTITDYGTIGTSFRAYTKPAFVAEQPSSTESIVTLEKGFERNPIFAKVYDGDLWHNIFVKQNNYTNPH